MGCCGLTKYGRRELILATVILWALAAGLGALAAMVSPWFACGAWLPVVVWGWVLWFFRDPERPSPQDADLFISPADGVVADITPIGPDSELGREGTKIGVFMNVFSVHVNRAPCDGVVTGIEHKEGKFLDVRDPIAYEQNESTTIRLAHTRDGQEYPVVFRQIAGLVARRIVTDLAEGQQLVQGERIGMIKFGSRLELFVPKELVGQVRVELGQQARAGLTVLVSATRDSG